MEFPIFGKLIYLMKIRNLYVIFIKEEVNSDVLPCTLSLFLSHIRTHAHTNRHTYTHTHTHTYTYTHMHTHMHGYIFIQLLMK